MNKSTKQQRKKREIFNSTWDIKNKQKKNGLEKLNIQLIYKTSNSVS